MLQRVVADGTGSDLKPIVLFDTLRRPSEGMLATKVSQHSLEPSASSTRSDSQPLGQRPQVTLGRTAPDPFPHPHQPKDTPPLQRFFFTTQHRRILLFELTAH